MIQLWSVVATIICACIEQLGAITSSRSQPPNREITEVPAEVFDSWWTLRNGDYARGMALLDQVQAALTQVCSKRTTSSEKLSDLLADLTVLINKPLWTGEPHGLRHLHRHLIEVHETVTGSPFAVAPDRWHRQGVNAAQGLHYVAGARDDVENQFGPGSWTGFTAA